MTEALAVGEPRTVGLDITELRPRWHQIAGCRPDPDWSDEQLQAHTRQFFPERGATAAVQAALSICEQCPDRARWACLGAALTETGGEDVGIRGGATTNQRRRLRAGGVELLVGAVLAAWDATTRTLDLVGVQDEVDAEQARRHHRGARPSPGMALLIRPVMFEVGDEPVNSSVSSTAPLCAPERLDRPRQAPSARPANEQPGDARQTALAASAAPIGDR